MPTTERDVVRLTQELVRIQSTNPTVPEAGCAEYIEQLLREYDLPAERNAVSDNRWNVVTRLEGTGGTPFVLLAHMDTVPVGDGWSHDPFGGEVEGGRMWGRGTCDMKGGLAASLLALLRVRDADVRLSGDLVLAFTVDEESSMTGAVALGDAGYVPRDSYILAAEPSDGKLLVAQKGATWYEMRFHGVSVHGSKPELGADANRALALAIEEAYRGIESAGEGHELLGHATLVVGVAQGGFKTNVVSDFARAEIDIRYPPSVSGPMARQVVEAAAQSGAARVPGVRSEVHGLGMDRPPVVCAPDSPLIAAVQAAHRAVVGAAPQIGGFTAYTDAAVCAIRSPSQHCVVYGPGKLAQAHTVDEYVELDDLRIFEETLTRTALALLAG